jgi:hypothetical protein
MKVVHPTGVRIATLTGASFVLEPDVERDLPDHLGVLALGKGARLVEESQPLKQEDPPVTIPTVEVEFTPQVVVELTDHQRLVGIMKELIKQGQPDSFRGDGLPKTALLNRLLGHAVTEDVRTAAWEEAMKG